MQRSCTTEQGQKGSTRAFQYCSHCTCHCWLWQCKSKQYRAKQLTLRCYILLAFNLATYRGNNSESNKNWIAFRDNQQKKREGSIRTNFCLQFVHIVLSQHSGLPGHKLRKGTAKRPNKQNVITYINWQKSVLLQMLIFKERL